MHTARNTDASHQVSCVFKGRFTKKQINKQTKTGTKPHKTTKKPPLKTTGTRYKKENGYLEGAIFLGGSFILQNGQNFSCLMGDVQEARNSNGYINDAVMEPHL